MSREAYKRIRTSLMTELVTNLGEEEKKELIDQLKLKVESGEGLQKAAEGLYNTVLLTTQFADIDGELTEVQHQEIASEVCDHMLNSLIEYVAVEEKSNGRVLH